MTLRTLPTHARRVALPAALVAAAWGPAPARRSPPTVTAPAGVYVLSRAAAARPPIPFAFQVAGGTVSGTVNGARLTLASDGTYTDDVVVRWEKAPPVPLPIPGLQPGPDPRVLRGAGRYTTTGDRIVLQPDDWISRGIVSAVEAKAGTSTLTLVGASGGLAGSRVRLDAEFTKIR